MNRFAALLAAWLWAAPLGAEENRLVAIGDSNTQLDRYVPVKYAEHAAARLGVKVVNAGCSGTTSRDWALVPPRSKPHCWLGRTLLLPLRNALQGSDVSIMLGSNDALGLSEPRATGPDQWGRGAVSPAEYRVRIENVIDFALEHGAHHVLLIAPPRNGKPELVRAHGKLAGYRQVLLELAAGRERVHFGPDAHRDLDVALHFFDGIHLNPAGHVRLGQLLARELAAVHDRPGPEAPLPPAAESSVRGPSPNGT